MTRHLEGIKSTHLVHLEQRPLAHLLECTHLPCIRLACKEDLAIASLPDLRDDLKLIDLELDAAFAEERTLPAAVRLPLLRVLGLGEVPLGGVLVEACSAILAGGDVTQQVEVVIEEI